MNNTFFLLAFFQDFHNLFPSETILEALKKRGRIFFFARMSVETFFSYFFRVHII